MIILPEDAGFVADVEGIELTDPNAGGIGGPLNRSSENLASRTKYLKDIQDINGLLQAVNGAQITLPGFTGSHVWRTITSLVIPADEVNIRKAVIALSLKYTGNQPGQEIILGLHTSEIDPVIPYLSAHNVATGGSGVYKSFSSVFIMPIPAGASPTTIYFQATAGPSGGNTVTAEIGDGSMKIALSQVTLI